MMRTETRTEKREESEFMVGKRIRLYIAGLTAMLLGMPLSEKALAGTGDIIWSSIDLTGGIIKAASNS